MTLAVSDFAAWSSAVHGQTPFPWQQRLLEQVVAGAPSGGWPTTLALPTSSGKTSTLDVALFALALQLASDGTERRTMPLRIALVVDRRIVVDAAYERALRIRRALEKSEAPVVRRVADALRRTGADAPLHVALLRGGIYREDRWARSPNQPTILCSTVDQVGSRLLHRGYGISPSTWPIHAGLLGNDTLVLLDEAHCSVPFHQTLAAVEFFRGHAQKPLGLPFVLCAMTATPRGGPPPFELADEDLRDPVLARRLGAKKPVTLEPTASSLDRMLAAMGARAVEQAKGGKTVLAVVNRVRSARALTRTISDALAKKNAGVAADVLLLTGRSRGVQRDALLRLHSTRLMAGRERTEPSAAARALIVVATQCVEVGADLDVDALLTEACPLDALRQRLGRLNRLGALETAPCFVFGLEAYETKKKTSKKDDTLVWYEDDIYGTALARSWSWLKQQASQAPIDGGVRAFTERCRGTGAELDAPTSDAPSMLPAYCELWAQTGPVPSVSPEPALFLHGPQSGVPEVQVVWRADVDDDLADDAWVDTIALCPPVVGETLTLRRDVVQRWLSGELRDDVSADVEVVQAGEQKPPASKADAPVTPKRFLVWRGVEGSEVRNDAASLRHGDTVVVPASYGGCDAFGWDPSSRDPVTDLALEARLAAQRAPVLRLHPGLLAPGLPTSARELADATSAELDDEALHATLTQLAQLGTDDALGATAAALLDGWPRSRKNLIVEAHPSGRGVVLIGRAGLALEARDFSDEDDSSSSLPQEITLDRHLGDVRECALRFCENLGLPRELVEDVGLAGWLHDLGKADPRFQAWLRGGNPLAARKGPLLAKSPKMPPNRAAMRAARERAGYPRGARHELLSVRLAESQGGALLERAHDRELVLHLIESHHGHCRPFAPAVYDERPLTVRHAFDGSALEARSDTELERVDSGVAERFFRLTRRYGWWGLSYLEACMRLADHRASELEARGGAR